MNSSRFVTAFLGSFLVMLFLLQWWQASAYPLWLWGGLFISAAITFALRRPSTIMTGCAVIGIALALLAVQQSVHVPDNQNVERFVSDHSVTVTGTIVTEPDIRQDRIIYTVATEEGLIDGSERTLHGRVLVTATARWPVFSYGDEIAITGKLEQPEEQWYRNYLRLSDVYTTMKALNIDGTGTWSGSHIRAGLISLKRAFEERIDLLFPEPTSSLLAGLLTGSRRGMPEDLTEAFQRAGLTHILAISGYNITIIITVMASLLFFLPLKYRLAPSIVAIIFFTLFVGASASVVRASIMGVLGLLALSTHRLTDARLGLLWTAFLMLLWRPESLWYDAGFQLSFLAVIGLMEMQPLLEKPMQHIPQVLGLREGLHMTIAAQLTAVPWVVYRFGVLSLICPIANIIVAPLIPLAMLFGFLATATGFVSLALGRIVGFVGWGILTLIIDVTRVAAAVPFAAVNIPSLALPILITYYILLVATVIITKRRAWGNVTRVIMAIPHPRVKRMV